MSAHVRTLRVKCASWDQVEAFYLRKLRRGRSVTIRVPFVPQVDDELAVGLELPNDLVVVIDGTVTAVHPSGEDRASIEIDLRGLTTEVVDRLEVLVTDGRSDDVTPRLVLDMVSDGLEHVSGAPYGVDLARRIDDPAHQRVVQLDGELRRMRQLAVHEVLGVPWDAGAIEVRAAWRQLCLRFHPDTQARHGSAAISHLAEELMILINRAYDRIRLSLVAEGRASAIGPALRPDKGWLVDFESIGTGAELPPAPSPAAPVLARGPASVPLPAPSPGALDAARRRKGPTAPPTVRFEQGTENVFDDLAVPGSAPRAVDDSLDQARSSSTDNVFERQARSRLAAGDHLAAREVLAAALHVYPRSGALRALYHVAAAMEALDGGAPERAVVQLEAALSADGSCREASTALGELQRQRGGDAASVGRLFR